MRRRRWAAEAFWEFWRREIDDYRPPSPPRTVPHDRKTLRGVDQMKSLFALMSPSRHHFHQKKR